MSVEPLPSVDLAKSHGGDHWATPVWVLDLVREFAPIALDPCSNAASLVCACMAADGSEIDGLALDWSAHVAVGSIVFANPPYSRNQITLWLAKAATEATRGVEIVLLLPSDTSTRWFNKLRCQAAALCFLSRRVRFVGAPGSPKFGSVIAYFGQRIDRFTKMFSDQGWCVRITHDDAESAPPAPTTTTTANGAKENEHGQGDSADQ